MGYGSEVDSGRESVATVAATAASQSKGGQLSWQILGSIMYEPKGEGRRTKSRVGWLARALTLPCQFILLLYQLSIHIVLVSIVFWSLIPKHLERGIPSRFLGRLSSTAGEHFLDAGKVFGSAKVSERMSAPAHFVNQ